ncbi:MAG: DUF3883 domain-containing protein [Actinomycetota bacterium]|nr:DUF3883 domain-containing protein [Actinomycetota bacterium]
MEIALSAVPDRMPGLDEANAGLVVWRLAGGPIDEVATLIDVLLHAELIRRESGGIRLTTAGKRVRTRNRADGGRPLALALVRAGLLHDQARLLLDTFPPGTDGGMSCRLPNARRTAPQLVGLLQLWPNATAGNRLEVDATVVAELTSVWALLGPPPSERAETDARRKSIGDRAEAYSYQLERLLAPSPGRIVWVAQDDDRLGYDIEDRSTDPRRRIEVKGSGGLETRFFMSDNEWRLAHEDPESYEVQFWGGIDLNRPVANEYQALRALGFPIVLRDLPSLVQAGELLAAPERWRIAATTHSNTAE